MERFALSTDEAESESPDAAAVEAAVRRLAREKEAYALLSWGSEFLQATRSDGRLVLERQEGAARWSLEGPPVDDAAALFLAARAGEAGWKDDPRWKRFSEEESALDARRALLARLAAAPLLVPRSADGALYSSSNGEQTAVFAFVSEASLRETCPDAEAAPLGIAELLALFLETPHDALFVESQGDWLSLDKAEARALLEVGGPRA
ncbi:MAG: hypothetical protein HY928_07475 [Elusimicrobia bacterium]|nr:hypothetical protein [Elusimicrobiota bacterium]